jgi:DNA-binding transcriptional MerR regulator
MARSVAHKPAEKTGAGKTGKALPRKVEQGVLADPGDDFVGDEIGYGGPQVCKIVGITYRQLDYWARTDLLRPSLVDAQGSGSQRRYSYRDLVALKVIKSLLDAGLSLQTARKAVDYLRDHLGEDLASASLVLDGSRSVLVRKGDDLVDAVRHGQGVLNIVPLAGLVEQLEASIHELDPESRSAAPARRGKAASADGGG